MLSATSADGEIALEYHLEKWKTIDGFGGAYDVSTHGRVRSYFNTGNSSTLRKDPRMLAVADNGAGYGIVNLFKNRRGHINLVSRLMANAFIPNPNALPVVRHKDGNPKNNVISNLEWGTCQDNMLDKTRHGTQIIGVKQPNAKLKDGKVAEALVLYANGCKEAFLARHYGVSRRTMHCVVTRQTWKHIC